jgi:hypothetical protein
LAEDAAEALDVLAHGGAAADDDGDVGFGHVDALVEDLGGDDDAVLSPAKALEDLAAFGDLGLMRDDGYEEAARNLVGGGVVLGEDEGEVFAVHVQQELEIFELGGRGEGELALAAIGLHGAAAGGAARRALHELHPALGVAHADALAAQEARVHRALGLVFGAFARAELEGDALGVVVGEVFAGEFDDLLAVDDGADEVREQGFAAVGALERGGEAEPEGGEALLRRQTISLGG